eukprot:gene9221-1507_t
MDVYVRLLAGAVLPLVSTVIKPNSNGFLEESLDRSLYRASQTPQAFEPDTLLQAYEKCTTHDLEFGTEVLHLVLKYVNVAAKLVDCNPNVWKVTYQQDLYVAEQFAAKEMRQVALVIGGGRGIGREVVRGLRERALHVVVVARTEEEISSVAREFKCKSIRADVGSSSDVDRIYQQVLSDHGRIDIVINCAGIAFLKSIGETTDEAWQEIMSSNLNACFYSCRRALACMQKQSYGGVIVNVGSSAAQGGRQGQSAYAASKAGIATLTETLALEGRDNNVLAFCVVPRRTYTSMRTSMYPNETLRVWNSICFLKFNVLSPSLAICDESSCLRPRDVAALIVSVALTPNALLSGQAFYAK